MIRMCMPRGNSYLYCLSDGDARQDYLLKSIQLDYHKAIILAFYNGHD